MAMNFPNSPAINSTFTVGSNTWMYDGQKWLLVAEALELDDLVGVSISSATNGQVLKFDGASWINDSEVIVSDTAPVGVPIWNSLVRLNNP